MTFALAHMKRFSSRVGLVLAVVFLAGCAPIIKGYRQNLAQGQSLTNTQVMQIHKGMTRTQVEEHLGQPVLTTVYAPNQMIYIFTMLPVHGPAYKRHMIITLHHHRVVRLERMGY